PRITDEPIRPRASSRPYYRALAPLGPQVGRSARRARDLRVRQPRRARTTTAWARARARGPVPGRPGVFRASRRLRRGRDALAARRLLLRRRERRPDRSLRGTGETG